MKKKILLILRGYKVLNGLLPGYMPVAALKAGFTAALPFVNIVASAMIVNALMAGEDFAGVVWIAVFTALINFGAKAVQHVLQRVTNYLTANIWWIDEQPLNEKQQEMDYAQIEDPETRFARQKLNTYRRTNGLGIVGLYTIYERLASNFLTVLISVSVFAPVLAGAGAVQGFWGFMNAPWFAALFLLLILGNALLGMMLMTRCQKKAYELLKGFHFPNMIGNYLYEKVLNKYQIGKDLKVNKLSNCLKGLLAHFLGAIDPVVKDWASSDARYLALGDIASNALSAMVYIFVAVKAVLGNFAIGGVVQYVAGITRFNAGFAGLASGIARLFSVAEGLELYFEFLDKPDKVYHGTIPVEKRGDNEYEIEFRNVSFQYPGSASYALKNLNLRLNIGQRMAVVGMNGSGKTTMIKLLCRLYDPTEGEITLNGVDIKKYDYQEYMSIFSVVFQDFKLFSFPLGQNVAASLRYDAKKTMECLEKAGVAERVRRMPQGLDTPLYKDFDEAGAEISGGEAQKIAIARALYKDAPFIVLDEPTAALDPIAEFEVYSKFNDIVQDKTAIFISHRLSSCRFCQDIAVFHEGELIQRGAHDELIAEENGKYHELWFAQAQYYVSG